MNKILEAAVFAADKHRNQRRKNKEATPYINHPLAVANILANEVSGTDEVVIIAGMLHDIIEDTKTTELELKWGFGEEVTNIVLEVSDDKTLTKAMRKKLQIEKASQCSYEAKLVKIADKIANLRDLSHETPVDWTLERVQEYFDWALAVINQIRGTHDQLESLFDEAYRAKPTFDHSGFGY